MSRSLIKSLSLIPYSFSACNKKQDLNRGKSIWEKFINGGKALVTNIIVDTHQES